jgi:hypothetical protein
MEAIVSYIPEWLDPWAVAACTMALLVIYQYGLAHHWRARFLTVMEHGHAPEGTVLVPVAPKAEPPAPAPPEGDVLLSGASPEQLRAALARATPRPLSPYHGDGLLAVLREVSPSSVFRARADEMLRKSAGAGYAAAAAAGAAAPAAWGAALVRVMCGATPEAATDGSPGLLAYLRAAKPVCDTVRGVLG